MLQPTADARIYAEALGKARVLGVCLTSCDVFTTCATTGYVHYLRHPNGVTDFVDDWFDDPRMFMYWKELMEESSAIARHRGHDECEYGVLIEYEPTVGITMSVARFSRSIDIILDSAENEMSEDKVYYLREWKDAIYIEQHGKVPGSPEFWSRRANGEYEYIPYDEDYNKGRAERTA